MQQAVHTTTDLFYELIRISLGVAQSFAAPPSEQQWEELMEIASKQSVLPLLFTGVEKLPDDQMPPRQLLKQWFTLTDRTETLSSFYEERAATLSRDLAQDGFRSCVLKGRSAAARYPVPERRTNGDIDIWVEGGMKRILPYMKDHYTVREIVYHHVQIKAFDHPEVEVHFTPSWMFNPVLNRRLQRYFDRQAPQQLGVPDDDHPYRCPDLDFDAAYQMIHIYRHLFAEGIGMKHLVDYYLVLRDCSREALYSAMELFKRLRMKRFCSAVMWVMQEVFALPQGQMCCAPDERSGRELLDEILLTGNFGKFDARYDWSHMSETGQAVAKLRRQARFIRSYPSELLWSPVFKTWHFFWRICKNHKH